MKNKRGFTLVEMLGVLIILIMVFMIVFPSLTKVIKDTNEKIDSATVSIIEEATASYLSEKSDLYPKGDDYTYCITLTDLIDNANLTEKQISSLDDKNMVVKTTFSKSKPTYVLTKTCTPVVVNIDFTLIGEKNMSFEVGEGGQYVEPGATALNKAGETVSYTVTITNSKKETIAYVDTTKVDIYTVKYSATIDGEAYSIERIVKVVDTTAPTIVVSPTTETISITNTAYDALEGVTASDNSGEIPTIKVSTNLSLGQAGIYNVRYTATDSNGNSSTSTRKITIAMGALIKMNLSEKEINVEANSGLYVDVPATATDENGNDVSNLINTIIKKEGKVVDSVDTTTLGTYYITYSITKDKVIYSETKRVNIVDSTPPVLELVINGKTTNAITLLANATDSQSGIKKYEFAIDAGSYIDNGMNAIYTYEGLTDTTHTLKVRVTNGAGMASETSINASPNEIIAPIYNISPLSTYATSKTVTVTYPVRQSGFVYTYSLDGGTTWITVASGTTATVPFTSNGTIIARVYDGVNYKTASSYTVTGIDTTVPNVSLVTSGMTTKEINVTATGSDAQSGIAKYEFSIDGNSYINNSTNNNYTYTGVTYGNHTLMVRVTNGAGLTSETSIVASTNDIPVPTYSISPSGWATSKTVTVTYPTRESGFIYTYSIDGGSTWVTVASGTTVAVPFSSNGTIIARIYDGVNYKTASSYTVSQVDSNLPTRPAATGGIGPDIYTGEDDAGLFGSTPVTIKISSTSTSLSGISSYEYYISTSYSSLAGGSWQPYDINANSGVTISTSGRKFVFFRSKNNVGTYSQNSDYRAALIETTRPSAPVIVGGVDVGYSGPGNVGCLNIWVSSQPVAPGLVFGSQVDYKYEWEIATDPYFNNVIVTWNADMGSSIQRAFCPMVYNGSTLYEYYVAFRAVGTANLKSDPSNVRMVKFQ